MLFFFLHWSELFLRLTGGNAIVAYLLMGVVAVLMAAGGSFFLATVLKAMMTRSNAVGELSTPTPPLAHGLLRRDVVVPLFMAVAVITICSCFSPLYATNTWCSPACYHTVGKSLWSGLLPYRDLYEHKGPLIYALYSLATLVSYKSFFGMYLFSLPFAFFFFYFSRKTLRLLTSCPIDPWFIIVGVGIYCLTCYFCGGSVEELFLPFLAYAFYVATLYLGTQASCERHPVRGPHFFMIGVGMAVVLWTKFNICAFYLAYILFFMVYTASHHRFSDFTKAILPVTGGFLLVTLPVLLCYWLAGGLDDLFRVYFHDNLFLYMEPGDIMKVTPTRFGRVGYFFQVLLMNIADNPMVFLAVTLAALWLVRRNGAISALYLVSFFSLVITVFSKPDYYRYYCFILAAYVPFCVLPLSEINVAQAIKGRVKVFGWLVLSAALVLVLVGSDNLWKMRLKKDDYLQFRFARTIMNEPNPTLLNYHCQDQGVFAVTGIVPSNRFYCDFNNELPDVHEEHDSIIACRGVQFVVTMYYFDMKGYRVVDQAMCPVKGAKFYLYKREDNVN